MFCVCGKQYSAGYTAMPELGGEPLELNYDFWVCANCKCWPQMVFEKETSMFVPRNATAILSFKGGGDGRNTLTWAGRESGSRIETMTYHPHPRRDAMVDQGRDVLVELWRRLDVYIDQIRDPSVVEVESEKIMATELAGIISLIMTRYYPDVNSVLYESTERWKARQTGEVHESPGLAESLWDPVVAQPKREIVVDTSVLEPQKKKFIAAQLDAKAFTAAQLGEMFGVSVQVVQAAYEEAKS